MDQFWFFKIIVEISRLTEQIFAENIFVEDILAELIYEILASYHEIKLC